MAILFSLIFRGGQRRHYPWIRSLPFGVSEDGSCDTTRGQLPALKPHGSAASRILVLVMQHVGMARSIFGLFS